MTTKTLTEKERRLEDMDIATTSMYISAKFGIELTITDLLKARCFLQSYKKNFNKEVFPCFPHWFMDNYFGIDKDVKKDEVFRRYIRKTCNTLRDEDTYL